MVNAINIHDLRSLYNDDGRDLTLAGWGKTESGRSSTDLMAVTAKVSAYAKDSYGSLCYFTYKEKQHKKTKLCRHMIRLGQKSYKGMCDGDSGGRNIMNTSPLVQHSMT